MPTENTGFSIINLTAGGGEVKLIFPEEVNTEDRSNWESVDVANALKPLFFANIEPQKITIDKLCIDNSHSLESVEPVIAKLRNWMRVKERESAPPVLQILTAGWQQRCVLTGMSVKRSFWTNNGICIRAYLNLTFEEYQTSGLQIEPTTRRRSGNSLSGRT